MAQQRLAGRRAPCRPAPSPARGAAPGRRRCAGSGTRPVTGIAHAGVGAVGDHRFQRGGVQRHRTCRRSRLVGRWAAAASAPRPHPRPRPAARRAGRPDTRRSCRRARSARPARRPRCSCCRPSCALPSRGRGWRSPVYSKTWPVPPPMPILAISARMMSLARHARLQPAIDAHLAGLRPVLEQALGRQHVLDLAGADAEGQRAERAVRRGVAVAADDGHARLGQPQLRADDVDDALPVAVACRTAGCRTRGSSSPAARSGVAAWASRIGSERSCVGML